MGAYDSNLLIYNRTTNVPQTVGDSNNTNEVPVVDTKGTQTENTTNENELQTIDMDDFSEASFTLDDFKNFIDNNSRVKEALGDVAPKEIFNKIDTDGDGELSEEELAAVSSGLSTLENLTPDALKKLVSDIEDASKNDDGEFEELLDNFKQIFGIEDAKETKTTAQPKTASTEAVPVNETPAAVASTPSYSAGSDYSGGGASPVYSSNFSAVESGETLEDVERAIQTKKAEKETNQSVLDNATADVIKAQDDKITKINQAQGEYEQAQKQYEDALKNDEKVSDELKARQEENSKQITENEKLQVEKEKEITEKDKAITEKDKEARDLGNQISTLETTITELNSKISGFETLISSLKSEKDNIPDGSTTEEKRAATDKRAQIQEKINVALRQKSEAEAEKTKAESEKTKAEKDKKAAEDDIIELQGLKQEAEDALNTLKEEFKPLDAERNKIEEEIKNTCSDETKQLLNVAQEKRKNVQTVTTQANSLIEQKKNNESAAKAALDATIKDLEELENKKEQLQNKKDNPVSYNTVGASGYTDNSSSWYQPYYSKGSTTIDDVVNALGLNDSSDSSINTASLSVDAKDFANKFNSSSFNKGVLAGKGEMVAAVASKYGLDPNLLASIMGLETGWGTSNAIKNYNNPGGMMDPKTGSMKLMHYSSLQEGVEAVARNLKKNYIDQGLTSISAIGAKYCPVGAANDPNGTNGGWVPSVTKIYNEMTGANINSNTKLA